MESNLFKKEYADLIDQMMAQLLPDKETYPSIIHEAMQYSLFAGGKRFRPILCLCAAEAVGGTKELVLPAACALELVHTYSLIHDDLPGMDNDDYRRGKLTNHKVYGEAIAILAGDGLLTLAFEWIADMATKEQIPAENILAAIRELAAVSGVMGMVGGQVADVISENKTPTKELLEYIHAHKTGALIKGSVLIGGILAGADEKEKQILTIYGENLGLAYQITDDILDIVGDEAKIGKPVGSDKRNNKATFPSLYGLENSYKMAELAIDRALAAIKDLKGDIKKLEYLAQSLIDREA